MILLPRFDADEVLRLMRQATVMMGVPTFYVRLAQHPGLTLTGMYNVLEKLRTGEALNGKEKQIHDAALVSVLRQLHDDLDAAVFAAYGWPATLTDAEILERVVALNAERAKEEASGLIRWLRPEYQNPQGAPARQCALVIPTLNPQLPPQTALAQDAG